MKKFYKFFFILLSLAVGGVWISVPANAAETVKQIDISVLRKTTTYGYTAQTVSIDLDEVWEALDLTGENANIKNCTLLMLDKDGNKSAQDLKFDIINDGNGNISLGGGSNTYGKTGEEAIYDGWFAADGTPHQWNNSNLQTEYTPINIKLFQAFYPSNDPSGEFAICHMAGMSPNASDTYTGRWAIETKDGKRVVFNVSVTFYTPTTSTGGTISLSKDEAPTLWESYGEDGVIQMYMGGWKYQGASALVSTYGKSSPNYKNNSNKTITDGWEPAKIITNYGSSGSGSLYYQYYFKDDGVIFREKSYGTGDNARSEFLEGDANVNGDPGKYRHTFNKRGNVFGKGNPFTVPCFGTFLKFEPEQNGIITLYVVQNGIVDLSDKGGETGGLQSELKWRPTYIVDELGNQLPEGDGQTGVTAEMPTWRTESSDENGSNGEKDNIGQKIYIGYDGSYSGSLANANDATTTKINAFKAGANKFISEHQDVWDGIRPYWGTGGSELKMIPPSVSKAGWIAINKTYVKYTFPVKAGKSYYVFNNDSQIGFCGYKFKGEGELTSAATVYDDSKNSNDRKPEPGSYRSVVVSRSSFKPGWNAICLPFSVTERKMREWFGSDGKTEDYELVTYNGCAPAKKNEYSTTEDGLVAHFFRHAYQDIIAGYPYMLYIPAGAKALTTDNITFENITIEENVEMATFSNSTEYMDASKTSLAKIDDFEFRGTDKVETIPAGSYAVYGIGSNSKDPTSTGIRYLAEDAEIKGLRSYLYPSYRNKKPSTEVVARIVGTNFSEIFDDELDWNDATVINDLMEEMGFFDQRENVYSITGQIVRQNTTSLVGLPKGVYIVKGKKYFVK